MLYSCLHLPACTFLGLMLGNPFGFGSIKRHNLLKTLCPRLRVVFNKLRLLMLSNPKGFLNIIQNQGSLKSILDSLVCVVQYVTTYVHKPVTKLSPKSMRVVCGSGPAVPHLFADLHETFAGKLLKTSEPCKYLVSYICGYRMVRGYLVVMPFPFLTFTSSL